MRSLLLLPSDPRSWSVPAPPTRGDCLTLDPGVGFEMRLDAARSGVWRTAFERSSARGLGWNACDEDEADEDGGVGRPRPAEKDDAGEASHSRARGGDGGSGTDAA